MAPCLLRLSKRLMGIEMNWTCRGGCLNPAIKGLVSDALRENLQELPYVIEKPMVSRVSSRCSLKPILYLKSGSMFTPRPEPILAAAATVPRPILWRPLQLEVLVQRFGPSTWVCLNILYKFLYGNIWYISYSTVTTFKYVEGGPDREAER
jgi:hypothetical protein